MLAFLVLCGVLGLIALVLQIVVVACSASDSNTVRHPLSAAKRMTINPATGYPMDRYSGVDVAGNAIGQGINDH